MLVVFCTPEAEQPMDLEWPPALGEYVDWQCDSRIENGLPRGMYRVHRVVWSVTDASVLARVYLEP